MNVSRETLADISGVDVSRETFEQLETYVELLLAANQTQNLIAQATAPDIWTRHIADSLQLVRLAPKAQSWLDIGSGAGLPGIVIAIATAAPTLLVESRRLRTTFLEHVAATLQLRDVSVVTASLANVTPARFDAITARAVASLDRLFDMTQLFSHPSTVLVFPKGKSAAEEVESVRRTWQGRLDIISSRTDANAGIVVARDVRRRGK
jgi:16S rRNA (guanine527-N7)-methyltransferase